MRSAFVLAWWLAVVVASLAAMRAHAATVPLIVEQLDPEIGALPADRVVSGSSDASFKAQTYAAIIPSRDHGVWYRIRLSENWTDSRPPVLAIFDPVGLHVEIYVPPAYAAQPRSIYSDDGDPGYTRHAIVFILPPALSAASAVYLHVEPERAIPRRVEVRDVSSYRAADLSRARLDVLFPSVQLATLLVMFAFFLALRERMYAYFVGYVLCLVIYELYIFGIGYELPVMDWLAPMAQRPAWCASLLAVALNLSFSRLFLDLSRWAPRIDRVLAAVSWLFVALAVCAVTPVVSRGWWIEDALSVLLLLTIPVLITGAVLAWQHGARRGGLFLGAWIPALLLVIVRVLQLRMQWPLPFWLREPRARVRARRADAFVPLRTRCRAQARRARSADRRAEPPRDSRAPARRVRQGAPVGRALVAALPRSGSFQARQRQLRPSRGRSVPARCDRSDRGRAAPGRRARPLRRRSPPWPWRCAARCATATSSAATAARSS